LAPALLTLGFTVFTEKSMQNLALAKDFAP
jgi:hypothetical protein